MKIIIDGVEHEVKNDVRIIYDNVEYGFELKDGPYALCIVANKEGLVYDVTDSAEEVVATAYEFVGDIAARVE